MAEVVIPKIRILLCQETIGKGGVEQRKLSVARYLDKNRYEIKVICTSVNSIIGQYFEDLGVEVIVVGNFNNIFHLSRYTRVLKVVKDFKPHIIHGAVFQGVAMACIAGYLGRVPIIIAEETSDPQNRTKKASILLRALTSVADKVVAISPSVATYLRDVAKIPAHKVHLINNGVEVPRAVSPDEITELKTRYGIKAADFVIGSVGRLYNDHKRFTDLLKGVSLLDNIDNIKVLIVGGGRDEQLIKDTADQLGLQGQLVLTGHQPDTAPFYQAMDVFCLASQREGFGLVVAEAMLHKLPVVATSVGGIKDIVIDDETGFLIPPLQPESIAGKLKLLMDNLTLRTTLGQAGYGRAVKEYTAEVYVEKVETLYKNLLKDNKAIN